VLVARALLILGASRLVHEQTCSTAREVNSADWGVTTANVLQGNATAAFQLQGVVKSRRDLIKYPHNSWRRCLKLKNGLSRSYSNLALQQLIFSTSPG